MPCTQCGSSEVSRAVSTATGSTRGHFLGGFLFGNAEHTHTQTTEYWCEKCWQEKEEKEQEEYIAGQERAEKGCLVILAASLLIVFILWLIL